jgi:hypothetical protein
MAISAGVWRFQPGSVKSGGTWQVEHFAFPEKSASPRRAASSSHDGPHVQAPVRPPVQAPADAGRERVVHGRVAQGALDAHGPQRPRVVEATGDAHHRAELQEGERRGRVVEVHLACLDRRPHLRRERLGIHLQSDRDGGPGTHARAGPAVGGPGDGLVQAEHASPEGLVAERLEPERLPPLPENPVALHGFRRRAGPSALDGR